MKYDIGILIGTTLHLWIGFHTTGIFFVIFVVLIQDDEKSFPGLLSSFIYIVSWNIYKYVSVENNIKYLKY